MPSERFQVEKDLSFVKKTRALLQPRFDYAYNAWYRGLEATVKNKLQTAKNEIIRYLFKYDCIGTSDFKIKRSRYSKKK